MFSTGPSLTDSIFEYSGLELLQAWNSVSDGWAATCAAKLPADKKPAADYGRVSRCVAAQASQHGCVAVVGAEPV